MNTDVLEKARNSSVLSPGNEDLRGARICYIGDIAVKDYLGDRRRPETLQYLIDYPEDTQYVHRALAPQGPFIQDGDNLIFEDGGGLIRIRPTSVEMAPYTPADTQPTEC
ncbi:hypothetical protein BBP40_008399 [Aspergillus hancockii]|nr:hypothetical protein BBP40_008399 [Aspergillus hancockii]